MDYSQILDKIIKPEYKNRFADWQKYARRDDLLGLECIGQIYSTKGTRCLHIRLPHEKQLYDTQSSLMKRRSNHTYP